MCSSDLGIRCGDVTHDQKFTVPGLGDPNVPQSSSVYVIDVNDATKAKLQHVLKPGLLIGQTDNGIKAFSGSHPNSVVQTRRALFVANGNDDTISIFDKGSFKHLRDIDPLLLASRRYHAVTTPRVSCRPTASHSVPHRAAPRAVPHQANRRKPLAFALLFAVLALALPIRFERTTLALGKPARPRWVVAG